MANAAEVHLRTGEVTTDPHSKLPFYPLDFPAYTTPSPLLSWQQRRDKNGVKVFALEFLACFFFTFMTIVPAGGFILTQGLEGSFLITVLCVSFSVMFSVYIAAPHSGAILSPAQLAVAVLFRGFPYKAIPLYVIAHFLGSFFGGVISYGLLAPYLDLVDGGDRLAIPLGPDSTAAIFVNMPDPEIDSQHLVLAEILGDIIFSFIICGLLDTRNSLVSFQILPILVGLAVFMVACVFGWVAYVLNPFRDFGPRVYLSHYYGQDLFSYHSYYSMIALWVPFAGAIIGAMLYDFLVGSRYHVQRDGLSLNGSSASVSPNMSSVGSF